MIKTKTATKKAPQKKTAQKDEPEVQILQTTKCNTVSGKSNITYSIGVDAQDKLFIRIASNSGGGFFSKEWVSIDGIKAVLENVPADSTISSLYLSPLFKGKSVNTPGYLLAALLNEGVLVSPERKNKDIH